MADSPPVASKEKLMTAKELQELRAVKDTLFSLIAWMAQSANSPISHAEAKILLAKLERES